MTQILTKRVQPITIFFQIRLVEFIYNSLEEVAPTTRAAHVDSAREPNRSAPIPAISPTLSPTLSAITPGFEASSSSSP